MQDRAQNLDAVAAGRTTLSQSCGEFSRGLEWQLIQSVIRATLDDGSVFAEWRQGHVAARTGWTRGPEATRTSHFI